MPAGRSILLVAHVTPPTTMSAARRAAGLTRYLGELGHRVTVLTSMMGGSGAVPYAWRTVRTRDLMVSRLNWRHAGLSALQGGSATAAPAAPSAIARWTVPDLQILGWTPFALPRAVALAARGELDCVITTSPPASAHLVGLALQRQGLPWVADFRDGWTFESQRPAWGTALLGRLDRTLERVVVTRADGVSAVTEPIAADLRDRFSRPVETITNGFDPAATSAGVRDEPARGVHGDRPGPGHSGGRLVLLHTGTLTFGGRPLGPLLAGVRSLRATAPALAERLEVRLVGPATDAERREVSDARLDDIVVFGGALDHERTLAAQRAADGLLVITGPGQTGVATGKLFEYLGAGRPILVIGADTAAAAIVRDADAGVAVDRDDAEALAGVLGDLVRRPEALHAPSPEAVTAFAYPALAARMAELVERAIDHRGRRGAR